LDVEDDLPMIEVDPVRIGQLLSNLLMNALRYTPAGGKIVLSLESSTDKTIEVSVSDTGVGIRSEDLAHIFDRFYRTPDSEGSGLGLAIAKQLVEAHGGQIRAESTPGSGTTIRIQLPC
jgi:signal transduction histidine kinase